MSKNISEKLRELRVFADGEADTPYEYFMLFVIVVNCACLGLDTSENLTQGFRNILFWTDKIYLGASLLTLCQIMTFDSWVSAVARPVGNVFPFSWIYFVSYSFTSAYVIMNFIVGVIVDFMREKQEMRTGSQI